MESHGATVALECHHYNITMPPVVHPFVAEGRLYTQSLAFNLFAFIVIYVLLIISLFLMALGKLKERNGIHF